MTDIQTDPSASQLAPSMAPGRMAERIRAEAERLAARAEASEQRSKEAAAQSLDRGLPSDAELRPKPRPATLGERIAAENLLSLRREATDWDARTMTLSGGNDQAAGRRAFRSRVSLANPSANITVASSIQALQGDGTRVLTLVAGATFVLESEGPVFVSGPAGTTVDILETYYDGAKLAQSLILLVKALDAGTVEETV